MLEQVPGPTPHIDQGALWTVAMTTGASTVAAVLAWLTAGQRARMSAEASMRDSFKMLTDELQREHLRLITISERQEAKIDALTKEVGELKAFSMSQTLHIERLERAVADAGLSVPRSNRA